MNTEETILQLTENYVKDQLSKDSSGHDWQHTQRVRKLALQIADRENADLFLVELAALLHDLGDYKLHQGDGSVAPRMISCWLNGLGLEDSLVLKVLDIVDGLSFSKSLNRTGDELNQLSIETKVVCDADRLDAIGAIGIARTFAFGGHFQREMHNPNIPPRTNLNTDAYRNKENSTTVNHFYEKLLLLKDKMYTTTGKEIAKERHEFMELFLERFLEEWG